MQLERNRLDVWQKWLIYGLTFLLFVSGAAWFLMDRFVEVEGAFGPAKHPLQQPLLVTHGTASFAYMLLIGTLLSRHVSKGWKLSGQRYQATLLLCIQGLLILTVPVMFYVGHEALRELGANLHLIAGLFLGAILPLHIYLCRRGYLSASLRGR